MTSTIERLRDDAEARLSQIAREFGAGSYLSRQCERAWLLAEGQAVLSVLNDDLRNAERVLDAALHLLEHAPAAARRAELSPQCLGALIGQAL